MEEGQLSQYCVEEVGKKRSGLELTFKPFPETSNSCIPSSGEEGKENEQEQIDRSTSHSS